MAHKFNIMIVFLFLDLSVVVNDMHTLKQDMARLTDLLNDHMKTGMIIQLQLGTSMYFERTIGSLNPALIVNRGCSSGSKNHEQKLCSCQQSCT